VPVFGTVFTGVAAALLAFFLDGDTLMDLISIGTLMAFVVVCLALVAHRLEPSPTAWAGVILRGTSSHVWVWTFCASAALSCISVAQSWSTALVSGPAAAVAVAAIAALAAFPQRLPGDTAAALPKSEGGQGAATSQPAVGVFVCPGVPVLPCLGAWVNLYLMASLPPASCVRLLAWSAAGAVVYLAYGVWHSKAAGSAAAKAM